MGNSECELVEGCERQWSERIGGMRCGEKCGSMERACEIGRREKRGLEKGCNFPVRNGGLSE